MFYSMITTYLESMTTMRKKMQSGKMQEDYAYWGMEDYVLENGRSFKSIPLTDDEIRWVFRVIGRRRFEIKQCFYNSQLMLMDARLHKGDHTLQYFEGYASGLIPVNHGWLVLNGEKIIDLTMRLRNDLMRTSKIFQNRLKNRVIGEFPEERQYFGVPFETDFVRREMLESGTARCLIDDFQNGWPLLRV